MAESLVDRLDAWADFSFVSIGTACKYMALKYKDYERLEIEAAEFEEIADYINTVSSQMIAMLVEEISDISQSTDIDELMGKVLDIVIDANEQKGTELNSDGKVQKPDGFVKPEARIHNLLSKMLGAKYNANYSESR